MFKLTTAVDIQIIKINVHTGNWKSLAKILNLLTVCSPNNFKYHEWTTNGRWKSHNSVIWTTDQQKKIQCKLMCGKCTSIEYFSNAVKQGVYFNWNSDIQVRIMIEAVPETFHKEEEDFWLYINGFWSWATLTILLRCKHENILCKRKENHLTYCVANKVYIKIHFLLLQVDAKLGISHKTLNTSPLIKWFLIKFQYRVHIWN